MVEDLTDLEQLPPHGARFTAAPPRVSGFGDLPGAGLRRRAGQTLVSGAAVDVLGWAGAAALLLAYALVTREPATPAGHRYLVLNLAGSAGWTVPAFVDQH